MMQKKKPLESVTVRRAKLADADKVRYRVYSTPLEFVAVIAESALMAVKVSGIKKPHKIIRDMPTSGMSVEAKKMQESSERVLMPLEKSAIPEQLVTELPSPEEMVKRDTPFLPLHLGELQKREQKPLRILPPEMVSEIIESYQKAHTPPQASALADAESLVPPLPSEPPTQKAAEIASADVVTPAAEAAAPPPEPMLTQKEKILRAADEVLPPLPPKEERILSSEEVGKLLGDTEA